MLAEHQNLIKDITWLVGDWHFGEQRLEPMCRPFQSSQEHDEELIRRHNTVVRPEDVVLCVGDVTNQNTPNHLSLVQRLNGRKILIRGNHDRPHSDEVLKQHFEMIVPEGEGLEFETGGISCFATHYPTRGRRDRFNIVGHVHGAWRYQLNTLNVCVDNFGFYPCSIDRVPFFVDAITNHYDEDVWAAYHEVNQSFRDTRGVKSSYTNQ